MRLGRPAIFRLVFGLALACVFQGLLHAEEERDELPPFQLQAVETAPGRTMFDHPADRLSVRLGAFLVRFNTTAQVDSETLGAGTSIDLESDTNLDRDKTEIRLDGHVRFGKRHRLDYGTMLFRRTGSGMIDQTIQFGDTVFNVNADVTTRFRNDVIKLAYRYDVVRRDRWDLGLSFGISAFITDVTLSASGGGGGMVSAESEDFIAPIPVIGLHTDVKLADRWYMRAGAEFFDVGIDDIEGSFTDTRVAFDWYPFEHFGFGLGYNRSRLTYEDAGIPLVDVSYTYSGGTAYISYVR